MFHRENGDRMDESHPPKAVRDTNSVVPSQHLSTKHIHPPETNDDASLQKQQQEDDNIIDEDEVLLPQQSERELRRPYEVQTPTKYRKPLPSSISKSYSSGVQYTNTSSPSTTPAATNHFPRTQSQPLPLPSQMQLFSDTNVAAPTASTTTTVATKSEQISTPQDKKSITDIEKKSKIEIIINPETVSSPPGATQTKRPAAEDVKTRSSTNRHEFQRTTDVPSVKVRYVNVTQRSAFAHYSLTPMIRELEAKLAQLPPQKHHRVSPSMNHLQALHRIYSTHIVRQIQFSPSTSIDADYHYQMQKRSSHESSNEENNTPDATPKVKRDGRYRCIDPTKIQNIFRRMDGSGKEFETFPSPPLFSYRKYRLPNRADVGFGRCTDDEIQTKQNEIRNETMWEETQVRTTCVISCIDLIRMADSNLSHDDEDDLVTRFMPYAGRFLRSTLTKKWCSSNNGRNKNDPSTKNERPHLHDVALPNPYSILAPPLESTYSASQGWRPRKFHDRPTGLRYCYVSPMNVNVWTLPKSLPPKTIYSHRNGNGEENKTSDRTKTKLMGSLALYTLPPLSKRLLAGSSSSSTTGGDGSVTAATAAAYHCQKTKSIPAFGKISEEFYFPIHSSAIPTPNTTTTMDSDRKAIFSYNPLDLVMESNAHKSSAVGPDSLYIVVRVYEMIALNESNKTTTTKMQLKKHVAFGITKVFSKTKIQWPDGQVKALQLYSYPVKAESQALFVERLWRIVHQKSFTVSSNDGSESTSTRRDDIVSIGISVDDSASSKRNLGDRLLRSPALQHIKHNRSQSANSMEVNNIPIHQPRTTPICGTAQLFISSLDIDFLLCMLPSISNTAASITSQCPLQLTDATGDFAVTTEINQKDVSDATGAGGNVSKRSNLIRLPQHPDRAGFSGSTGCHEILYLPARPDKQYHVDNHMALSRSILNFLYIYPRLIRSSTSRRGIPTTSALRFTIRIQVLHSDRVSSDEFPFPIACFYNHASWDESSLVSSIYTNVVETSNNDDEESGIAISDEIRVRLPDVLDGKYKVEFTLYSIEAIKGKEAACTILATASIPLTSTRSNDKSSDIRVVTIVPNGKHRLELGDFHFHFETRILSSIHTCDPFLVTHVINLDVENTHGMCEVPIRGSHSSAAGLSLSIIASHYTCSKTSINAVVAFFQVLLYLNLNNLIKASNDASFNPWDHLHIFYLVLKKVKSNFLSTPELMNMDYDRYIQFMKSCEDLFDESCLFDSSPESPSSEVDGDAIEATEPLILEFHGIDDDGFEVNLAEKENNDRPNFNGNYQHRFSWRRWKSQIERNLSVEGVPFSRVPFDTSEIKPSRPDSEFRSWRGHVTPLYDDDETIATAPSMFSTRRSVDTQTIMTVRTVQEAEASTTILHSYDENSIVRHEPVPVNRSVGETEFVKRVRNAAAIIIAPCVAPSLANMLKSPSDFSGTISSPFRRENKDLDSNVFTRTANCLCLPGSDKDEEVPENSTKEFLTNRRNEGKAIRSIRERLGNGKASYRILTKAFDKESPESYQTFYEVLITMTMRIRVGQYKFGKSHTIDSDELHKIMSDNLEFIVPLCLRSIIVRHCNQASQVPSKVHINKPEFELIEGFVVYLVRCLIYPCKESSDDVNQRKKSLQNALSSSQIVLDFIVGLSSVIEAKQVEILIFQYLQTLRNEETTYIRDATQTLKPALNEEISHLIRCSQQLRLIAAEALCTLPSFLALNVPMKYSLSSNKETRKESTTWLTQYVRNIQEKLPDFEKRNEAINSGWLSDLVMNECFCICSVACQFVIYESIALVDASPDLNRKVTEAKLRKDDLVAFQCTAFQAISIVYELVVRRHSMDQRFQSVSAQSRIAGMLTKTILEQTCENVQWLSKLDCANQVRSTWLLCYVYALQDAPQALIYEFIKTCFENGMHLNDFIHSLNLCRSTFHHLWNLEYLQNVSLSHQQMMPSWLIHETFNTICAAAIVVIDVSVQSFWNAFIEKSDVIRGILELLLYSLTMPQSPVTQLRAVGVLLLVLERDVRLFLEIVDASIEHWIRIMLSLMNCQTLCVRSIAVDLVVSLLIGIFVLQGSIDPLTMILGSVLPEVIMREIGLYCVSGHITTMDDVAKSVWPIRRAIADIGDANPLDDDRIDPVLAAVLCTFSRACQAIIDGVLIELRLRGCNLCIVGVKVEIEPQSQITFDADEESLFEAASFFTSEVTPMQRIRWLLTLKKLHASRNKWLEAAECLFLCATTICLALPRLKDTWWPSSYEMWSDVTLFSFGAAGIGHHECGNVEVMALAEHFLEPHGIGATQRFSIKIMCELLVQYTLDAIEFCRMQYVFDAIYHHRLQLLSNEFYDAVKEFQNLPLTPHVSARIRKAEDESALDAVSNFLSKTMHEMNMNRRGKSLLIESFVAMKIHGRKPNRFEESTTIPTFLEWNKWCVCRNSMTTGTDDSENMSVEVFAKPYIESLRNDDVNVILRTNVDDTAVQLDSHTTYIDIVPVKAYENGNPPLSFKHFVYQSNNAAEAIFHEVIVANDFPCAISRQRALEI